MIINASWVIGDKTYCYKNTQENDIFCHEFNNKIYYLMIHPDLKHKKYLGDNFEKFQTILQDKGFAKFSKTISDVIKHSKLSKIKDVSLDIRPYTKKYYKAEETKAILVIFDDTGTHTKISDLLINSKDIICETVKNKVQKTTIEELGTNESLNNHDEVDVTALGFDDFN